MARKSPPLLCGTLSLGHLSPQAIQPSQENATITSHVVSDTLTDEEKVMLLEAQAHGASVILLPWQLQPQKSLQLQFLLISH